LGETPDPRGGGPGGVGLRPGHHGLGERERSLLLGQSGGTKHPIRELEELITRRLPRGCAAKQRSQFSLAESVLGSTGAPVLAKPSEVDVLLALARLVRRQLRGVVAAVSRGLNDLRPSA